MIKYHDRIGGRYLQYYKKARMFDHSVDGRIEHNI